MDARTPRRTSAIADRLQLARSERFGEHGGPQFAHHLGLPPATWDNYERGVTIPGEVLLRFLVLTGTEPRWLLQGEGPRYRGPLPDPTSPPFAGEIRSGSEFDITIQVTVSPVAGTRPVPLSCPACQAPLELHQPEKDLPHRLLATCSCAGCGIWFAVVPARDRAHVYLLRMPAIAEMREAIARQGEA